MSDPHGSERIQEGVPAASGTGDNSSTGTGAAGDPDASGPRYDDRTRR